MTGDLQQVEVIRRHWLSGEFVRGGLRLGQDRGGPADHRRSRKELLPVGPILAARRREHYQAKRWEEPAMTDPGASAGNQQPGVA
jgi:hypothetical protein